MIETASQFLLTPSPMTRNHNQSALRSSISTFLGPTSSICGLEPADENAMGVHLRLAQDCGKTLRSLPRAFDTQTSASAIPRARRTRGSAGVDRNERAGASTELGDDVPFCVPPST